MDLLLLFIGSILVNNFVLTRFLGICPFLSVSKKVETAVAYRNEYTRLKPWLLALM